MLLFVSCFQTCLFHFFAPTFLLILLSAFKRIMGSRKKTTERPQKALAQVKALKVTENTPLFLSNLHLNSVRQKKKKIPDDKRITRQRLSTCRESPNATYRINSLPMHYRSVGSQLPYGLYVNEESRRTKLMNQGTGTNRESHAEVKLAPRSLDPIDFKPHPRILNQCFSLLHVWSHSL